VTLYQTEQDTQRECLTAHLAAKVLRCHAYMIAGVEADADCIFTRNTEARALVEVKCRTNERLAYDTYMVDSRKLDRLSALASGLCLRPLLVVRFSDALCCVNVDEARKAATSGTGGRKDRADVSDIDHVYYIPIQSLKLLTTDVSDLA
jgi:Holliday junction resolvase-like predicted endonuclease